MISATEYKTISDLLGSAHALGVDIANSVLSMTTTFNDSVLPQSNRDRETLTRALSDTYEILVNKHTLLTTPMLSVVQELQEHVAHRHGSVDAYLEATGVRVSDDFASLSAICGYEIDPSYLE